MKAVILAGGFGSRITEESQSKPKPMVEIGGKPILWHIMKIYSLHGIRDFIVCCGYKGYVIKDYFANYSLHMSDLTIDMVHQKVKIHQTSTEPWTVTLVDTGENTMTGGRLKRVKEYVKGKTFCMSYGDGVGDIDLAATIQFHKKNKFITTVTAVQSPGRFGALTINQHKVTSFQEKPHGDGGWINGGFFVMEPETIDYIDGDETVLEHGPLVALSNERKLGAFKHHGFWHPMDTLRDKNYLDQLWDSGKAPWKIWA